MLAVGVHAAGLGPDPAFLWECDDTGQCEDLWAEAREHDRMVTLLAAAAAVTGWFLAAEGRRAETETGDAPTPGGPTPQRRGVDVPVVLLGFVGGVILAVSLRIGPALTGTSAGGPPGRDGLLIAALTGAVVSILVLLVTPRHAPGRLWVAAVPVIDLLALPLLLLALGRSLHLAAAVTALAAVIAALIGRTYLEAHGRTPRDAHRIAGLVALAHMATVLLAVPLAAVTVGLGPLVFVVALLPPLLHGLWFTTLGRGGVDRAPAAPCCGPPARRRARPAVVLPAAAAIVLMAAWAAWPVPAPPADATPQARPARHPAAQSSSHSRSADSTPRWARPRRGSRP